VSLEEGRFLFFRRTMPSNKHPTAPKPPMRKGERLVESLSAGEASPRVKWIVLEAIGSSS
jgi:hypothetical protein